MNTDQDLSSNPDPGHPGIQVLSGHLSGEGLRIGIVAARYNGRLTGALVRGCVRELTALGVAPEAITLAWVPGAYEVPYVADQWAKTGRFNALIGLGCVIQGETPHAGLVNAEVARGLAEIARQHRVPVIDTVVCANTLAQAEARCVEGPDGRGTYAARAAVDMARLDTELRGNRP
ncbi:MAG: 6,7-dimethyl-8-ribityllumazine synthase [Kiritimatiellia bacterium]|nr:6,7-dimethyl-8-ribityllumazine synthase [Kiritimatiellia bacterium]